MDQDTSKTPGKGSWRDRLGIGAGNREMPKLSGEFKGGRDGQNGTASSETTPRGPQIVTKTAPMAPRTPAAVQDKSSDRRAERRPPPDNQQQGDNQDLAMRLKAQREAAEKVAHQRVSQARGRAERGGSEKPRFSFAEEEVAQARRETTPARDRGDGQPSFANKLAAANQTVTAGQPGARSTGPGAGPTLQSSKSAIQKPPPLLPPRPALGGEKPISGPPAYPSRYTPSSQQTGSPGYRPLDPPSYQANRAGTRHTAVPPLGEAGDRKLPGRDGAEAFRRRVDPDHPEGAGYHDYQRGGAARARTPAYNDDSGDLFEEERPTTTRRRASAQDYNEAYREFDESYGEEGRRRGPWLLLLFLLIAAIAAGGIIYYYLTEIKPAGQSGGNVPVINAPEQPAKVDPEPNSTTGQQAPGATDAQRKQIYDRILGDEAIDGNQIVPTEQQPKAVEPSATGAGQTGNQTDPAQPGANNTANPDGTVEPLPLPLPPPPGENGQQGALTNGSSQEAAAVAAKELSTSASATAGNSQPSSSDDIIEPIAGEADGPEQPSPAKPVVEAKPKVVSPPQSAQDTELILDKPVAATKPVAAKKPATKTAAKAKPAAGTGEDAAQAPLVLVPQRGTQVQGAASAASSEQSADQPAAKEGPFNGIFKPTGKKASGSPTGKRRDDVVAPGSSRGNWTSAPPSVGDGASNEQVSSITASLDPPAGPGLPEQQGAPQETATVQQGVPLQQVVAIEPGEPVQQGSPAPEGQPVQQIAAVQQAAPEQLPESAPAQGSTAQEKPPSGQYIAQLASFQSQAEAMAEYNRLQAAHGDVLRGLKPTVSASTISGRYRLGVGPMASREAASNICNALISAGERDCLVRGN